MPEEEKVAQEGSGGPGAREWGRSSAGEPPGERTAPVPQASRMESGYVIRVFGRLHRRAQQSLLGMLRPEEEPRVVIAGAAGSAIVGTDDRALVVKAGARFGAPFRAITKAFEYESVIGVRLDTETSPAVVAIDAPHKIATSRVYWVDSRDDPWKARNAIPVDAASFGTALEQVVQLRALIAAYRERHPALARQGRPGWSSSELVKPIRPQDPAPVAEEGGVVQALPVFPERCPHCRAELRSGWRFCPRCGAPSETPTGRPQ